MSEIMQRVYASRLEFSNGGKQCFAPFFLPSSQNPAYALTGYGGQGFGLGVTLITETSVPRDRDAGRNNWKEATPALKTPS